MLFREGFQVQKKLLAEACNRHSLLHTPPFSLSNVPVKPHSSPGRGPRLHSSTISRSPAHHSRAPKALFGVETSTPGMQLQACCPPALAPAHMHTCTGQTTPAADNLLGLHASVLTWLCRHPVRIHHPDGARQVVYLHAEAASKLTPL